MELMTQLEHDKAEAKRQKPKLNPSQAKIEGLLAKLPEPGAHSISFQHVQQQQQQHQQQLRQQQQHLNNTTWIPNRSPSPAGVRSSHIMVMPSQPLAPMMGYNMYGYGYPAMPASYYPSQPVPQQHMMRQPPRSASAMSMNRR
ncbi:uncharacterized protein BX664DRAFT_319396 [Halteromyces radiatus]|uniref:uncharacterized protein n=1 Tax=Halteromyces radiatus TaxID=101107 RepID=UPI00221EBAD1|nr:uncharacterized protein BX664DRAFT_319396 [Halteromyces radiatus]KAI8098712.1 hypothetical protein BX664DRAFT_319396 [Halteromyces radiatus]